MSEDLLVKDMMDDMSTLQKATQTILKYLSDLIVDNNKLRAEVELYKKQAELSNQEVRSLHSRYRDYLT